MKRSWIVLMMVMFAGAGAQSEVPEGSARLHYSRPDGAFAGWALHVWEDTSESVTWETGLEPTGTDDFGVYWDVGLTDEAELLGFLVHKGDEKDPGPDMFLDLTESREAWVVSGDETVYTSPPDPNRAQVPGDLTKARAHWLDATTLAWDAELPEGAQVVLYTALDAGLELTESGIERSGPTPIAMTSFEVALEADPAGLDEDLTARFPHLAEYAVYKTDLDAESAGNFLRGQLVLAALGADDELLGATGVQIPGVLDDLYAEAARDEPLGVVWNEGTPTVRVWAPTAQSVKLHLFPDAAGEAEAVLETTFDPATGIWSVTGTPNWGSKYYLFEVQVYAPTTQQLETNLVTDPYALSLSTNSARSQIVNLDDPALKPEGWDTLAKPPITAPEDISVYELHVRDFSATDETVPEALRGTYAAFSQRSDGTRHLRALADAGLTHLHLLPVFDIATINEDKTTWKFPEGDLTRYPPNSSEQQEAVSAVRDQDPFNWGYDPLHYTVPEGSYATDPEGAARTVEFRQMVKSLNESRLRVVMDVVYNHTNSSGQTELSVLDRIVPGYYHRLNADGVVETSTCCQNTATEHAMMEKLMVDSLVTWARDYKVDGFRFDLMGHHLVRNMEAVQRALRSLTVARDGVDGASIYLYGEGWDFGEVAGNARGKNATQRNLAGTGIGTFNDRLRDAARGGTPFSGPQEQGFVTGLYTDPNGSAQGTEDEQRQRLLQASDQIRVGLAGNLADYTFQNAVGETVRGADVLYGEAPAGYTQDPQENIVYVSAHDNETLFDAIALKAPLGTSTAERVRMQNLGLSLVALSQGVPFFHAGSDLLRSKSLDRNSYNSGDLFNQLDFSYRTNNWGVGLPPESENEENWPLMSRLLGTLPAPSATDIRRNAEHMREMLTIRGSSSLFRLQTAEDVQEMLSFYNTGPGGVPGVIVMHIADEANLDSELESITVVFNGTPELQTLTVPELANKTTRLHPVQQAGGDPLVKFARARADGTLQVPGRTTAVFVEPPR
ncbi:MAG: GH13_13 / GH13_37 / CBM41 / GH13 / GH13_ 11 / GH13_14 / GH13_32 [uncultured Truepera sp.]|uniref:GH13_13 / GH13_37 / CBM41 / GH13 / GH13_ 11 / GH13_14 / GH13_32 n=1 Tax=uncultured Truepera sp. TaxID=543023 RepID=A0A6J4V5L1_9DEIN|nr:MAG: GH13_13 / GH13_37 / CBM41 / GH13 / GH13_ 11 / GH13_14 / GH13_32 [uncultured Truepera sp.]